MGFDKVKNWVIESSKNFEIVKSYPLVHGSSSVIRRIDNKKPAIT